MAHRSHHPILPSAVLALTLSGAAAHAQQALPEPGAEPAPVALELQRLNSTLTRIADLLERQLQGQRLDLMLQRLNLESRRVSDVEGELSGARSSRSSLVDERQRIQNMLSSMVEGLETAEPAEVEEEAHRVEEVTRQAEGELKIMERRIRELDARILELENELTRRRDDLRALQDRLDRELDGLE